MFGQDFLRAVFGSTGCTVGGVKEKGALIMKALLIVSILSLCLLLPSDGVVAQGQQAYEAVSPRRLPGVTIIDEKDGILWVWMLTGYFYQPWLPNPQNLSPNQQQQDGAGLPKEGGNCSSDIPSVYEQ